MKLKYLPIVPLLVFNTSFAQTSFTQAITNEPVATFADNYGPTYDGYVQAETNDVPVAGLTLPPRYGGGRRSTFFGQMELGYVISSTKKDTVTGGGGSMVFKLEYGWRHLLPTRFASRYNFLAISLCYSWFSPKEKYTYKGIEETTKYRMGVLGLPISYSSINNERTVGFYWQIGANINYLSGLELDRKAMLGGFKKIYIEPTGSLGVSFRYDYKGHDMCGLIGPYVGYAATNLASEKNAEMKLLTVGIRYTSIIF